MINRASNKEVLFWRQLGPIKSEERGAVNIDWVNLTLHFISWQLIYGDGESIAFWSSKCIIAKQKSKELFAYYVVSMRHYWSSSDQSLSFYSKSMFWQKVWIEKQGMGLKWRLDKCDRRIGASKASATGIGFCATMLSRNLIRGRCCCSYICADAFVLLLHLLYCICT